MEHAYKKPSAFHILFAGLAGISVSFFPLLLIAVPSYFGYLLLAGGMVYFFTALFMSAAGAFLLLGAGALYLLAGVAVCALAFYVMLKKQMTYFDTALCCAAIVTLTLYVLTGLNDLLAGAPAFSSVQPLMRGYWEQFVSQMRLMPELFPTVDIDEYALTGKQFAALLPVYMPVTLCIVGALSGLINTLICVRACKRARVPIKPMQRFLFWRLPKNFTWGILTMMLGVTVLMALNMNGLDSVMIAVVAVAGAPLVVQGAAVYWFLLGARRASVITVIVTALLLLITIPLSLLMLALFGIAEQVFHIRKRLIRRSKDE